MEEPRLLITQHPASVSGRLRVRIGVDIGGINTIAVLMDQDQVATVATVATTDDVVTGVGSVLGKLLDATDGRPDVFSVAITTPQFADAITSLKLTPTACVRLGPSDPGQVPPLAGWPDRVRRQIGEHIFLCDGGHEFDGRAIAAVNREQVLGVAEKIEQSRLTSAAVTSVFSTSRGGDEIEVASLLRERLPNVSICVSHEIGQFGLLERENATIINAALLVVADTIVTGLDAAIRTLGFNAPLYIARNDGTLMDSEYARNFPTATLASEVSHSLRGAALLAGVTDCVVISVGRDETSIGAIVDGYPRRSGQWPLVAGVQTNLRMPLFARLPVGSGTVFDTETAQPMSGTAEQLSPPAAVMSAHGEVRAWVSPTDETRVPTTFDTRCRDYVSTLVSQVADGLRITHQAVPAVLVGAGSVILPDELPGFELTIRPPHFEAACAVGTAVAGIGGESERFYSRAAESRTTILSQVHSIAVENALLAGAADGTIQVLEIDEVPVTYLPGDFHRIRVGVVGDLPANPS